MRHSAEPFVSPWIYLSTILTVTSEYNVNVVTGIGSRCSLFFSPGKIDSGRSTYCSNNGHTRCQFGSVDTRPVSKWT